jgi:hypothetical protein
VLAPLDPLRFAQVAHAYELMPDGFWALLSIIVAFYFGGRMRLKRQDMAVKGGALAVAQEVLAIRRAAREQDQASDPVSARAPASAPEPAYADPPAARAPLPQPKSAPVSAGHANRVIDAWKARRALAAQN